LNLHPPRYGVRYLEIVERREKAEAEDRETMKRRADLEGRRLLAVRAAENVGFWYAANLEDGVGGPRVSIATIHCYLFRLFCACLLALYHVKKTHWQSSKAFFAAGRQAWVY
jgi:hypothetical protein